MSKKKRFGISQSLNRGFSDTIQAVENNAGAVRFEVASLSRIETDPENPRELTVTPEDIRAGRLKTAPGSFPKDEIENLERLAGTIQKKGLINPIVVYKHNEKYRLVAGERRFLAALIAGKEDIQVRILNEKPKPIDLRLLQWIENTEREDLSLKDRIGNIKAIVQEHRREFPQIAVTATLIKELIGISLSQATSYVAVLEAPNDLMAHIMNGNVNNLEKAATIAKIQSPALRKEAIEACINGNNLKQLKSLIEAGRKAAQPANTAKKRGRVAKQINMGATGKPFVIKKIVAVMLSQAEYKPLASRFAGIDWSDYGQVTKAFRDLIGFLEKEGEKAR